MFRATWIVGDAIGPVWPPNPPSGPRARPERPPAASGWARLDVSAIDVDAEPAPPPIWPTISEPPAMGPVIPVPPIDPTLAEPPPADVSVPVLPDDVDPPSDGASKRELEPANEIWIAGAGPSTSGIGLSGLPRSAILSR